MPTLSEINIESQVSNVSEPTEETKTQSKGSKNKNKNKNKKKKA